MTSHECHAVSNHRQLHFDGLMQGCSNSSALAVELLQCCTKPSFCSTVCSGIRQRQHQSSVLLAFVSGIHRWPADSPHKGPVTGEIFPWHGVSWEEKIPAVMFQRLYDTSHHICSSLSIHKYIFDLRNVWSYLTISRLQKHYRSFWIMYVCWYFVAVLIAFWNTSEIHFIHAIYQWHNKWCL